METLRQWLNEEGFDWTLGTIIVNLSEQGYKVGVVVGAELITRDHKVLDMEFDSGYGGGVACPNFIAEDTRRIYFASQYDGATAIRSLEKDVFKYLDWEQYQIPVV